jgi:carboxypeptidase C (cathepsin A)
MRRALLLFAFIMNLAAYGAAESNKPGGPESKPDEAPKKEAPAEVIAPVIREASVIIEGKAIPYKVTTGKLILKDDEGKPRASIFHVSYERSDTKDAAARPVMFAFNGGPGSSAVWLHIGVLGPKIVQLPGDGTLPVAPPARVIDNPLSILDVCDLVFVDPVSTGYSRAEKGVKAGDFHGLDEDIQSVGDFIRRWISENDRWNSPKYLLGESYGGIRVAGLSSHLQSRYGMSLNGVILLSSLLDFSTLQAAQGNDLAYKVFLPAFTGVAHFHRKIEGDRDALVNDATRFAFGDYAAALLKGADLDDASRGTLAERLADLTGIDAATWVKYNLRIDATTFRAELLKNEGKTVGRFDGRVAWDSTGKAESKASYDPSYSLALGAFSTAMLDYLGRDLGYKEEQPYEILTGKVQPWRWNATNQVVNVSDRLATALRDNPHLRILVMGGYTDLATPPEGMNYSIRHMLGLSNNLRENIFTVYYDGGHMFYLNPPDLEKCRKDLVDFIKAGTR